MHSALALTFGLALAVIGNAQVNLGTAAGFGIVATSAITSTGLTIVNGDIGISPNGLTSITGFPPGISTNPPHGADAVAAQAHADAQTAYNAAQALPFTTSLTGQDLGGLVLGPGVYNFASSAQLTGILTLDGQNNANSVFVFQMGSTITTATAAPSSSSMVLRLATCSGRLAALQRSERPPTLSATFSLWPLLRSTRQSQSMVVYTHLRPQ